MQPSASLQPPAPASAPDPNLPLAAPVDSRGRVLLVDDDRVVASVFRRLLQQRGYEVLVAGDGGEALAVAKEGSPEVVLMDLQMPRMGGLEALGEFSRQFPTCR